MKTFDKTRPLIYIHIPKTAGVSVRQLFQNWFGDNLYFHYYDGETDALPEKLNIDELRSDKKPMALFGHFNETRGFGIQKYYPNATQFITILRDPWERAISGYFYSKKVGLKLDGQLLTQNKSLEKFLTEPRKASFLHHFPREVTFDNYKDIIEEFFVEVGVVERLHESLTRISGKLGFPYNQSHLQMLNASERDQEIPSHVKARYMERHRLEYEVYDWVLSRYE